MSVNRSKDRLRNEFSKAFLELLEDSTTQIANGTGINIIDIPTVMKHVNLITDKAADALYSMGFEAGQRQILERVSRKTNGG